MWHFDKQDEFLSSVNLHHEDSLDLFQFWYALSDGKGLTLDKALEMFDTFPETRRRDIATIGLWVHQMEKVQRQRQRKKSQSKAQPARPRIRR